MTNADADTRPLFTYERRSRVGKGATMTMDAQHGENVDYGRGFAPDAEIVDFRDNASGWNEDKIRPDWEEMLERIAAGEPRAVIAWHSDRYTRQPAQLEQLIKACRRGKVELHTRLGGHHSDPTMIRIEMALAAKESDTKSQRLTLKHEGKMSRGEFPGGRRRFGFTDSMTDTMPAEADAIRDACARVLDGESVSGIARLWNAAGLRTPDGNKFSTRTVSALLRGRHLAKLRVNDGMAIPARWPAPAVISYATSTAVIRRLEKNGAEYTNRPAPLHAGRVYDYSGMPLCGDCGTRLYGVPTKSKSGAAYVCRNPRRNGAHGQAPVKDVDAVIRAAVIARLVRVDAAGVFVVEADATATEARQAERATLNARLDDELPASLAAGVSARTVAASERLINARLAELDADDDAAADAVSRPRRVLSGLVGLSREETAAAFDALDVDRRRNVVAELGTPVLVGRNARKGVFNPRRVWVVWTDDGRIG